MKRRILESEDKLLIDDEKDDIEDLGSDFDSDDSLKVGSEPEHDELEDMGKDDLYGYYSDLYKERHNIRPRWVHPSDVSEEELRSMIRDLFDTPVDEEEDDFDSEEDKQYWDDLDSKSSEDSEIEDLAAQGPEGGEEFHSFAGMGKGRHGKNRIHEKETDEVAPPGGEKLVKALKKQKGVKNPWAVAWSKYNKGELKENSVSNRITIGQLRQIIREELLRIK